MNIFQRLNAVMKAVTGVSKERFNEHQKYNYQGHADVTAAVRKAYVDNGIVRTAAIVDVKLDANHTTIVRGCVTWVSVDDPNDRHSVDMWAVIPSTSAKGPSATQTGIALSYIVKQAELKTLALTDDDTPDAASEEITRATEKARDVGAFDVDALLRNFHDAENERDIQNAKDAVNKHIAAGNVRGPNRDTLKRALDAAVQRINGFREHGPGAR